ncbi:putative 26S proteasome regulatory subunit [Recurvomyces mirabilis]|nr:putative 26S proteasome regulatory subunit [Recurvomyces mirabilis]
MDDLHAPIVSSGPTSQSTANGTEEMSLVELMAKKHNLEAELSALGSVLESHKVDMTTPLLTPDGFPRADIDVAQIRTTRAQIIRLKNDYKGIMGKLEVAVHEHFAAGKTLDGQTTTARVAPAVQSSTSAPTSAIEPPFARVNTVVPDSPADHAGLKAGDKVVRFGSATWTNHERLSKVAQVVQQNENRTILVKVLRETSETAASSSLDIQLTPRRNWGGRGLLGCHLVLL